MATTDTNLAGRSGSLVESHKNYDPRIVFFYFVLAGLLLTLAAGLAYQQLTKVGDYATAERQQNQRRILFPGPRGNIYDRHGRVLVENKHRFAVLLHLDELKSELNRERIRIRNNYRATGDRDVPDYGQLQQIARVTVVQRYLDEVNRILGRDDRVDAARVRSHFARQLLLPYTLVDDLKPPEFARLVESLPVQSPLEVYAFNVRSYPHGSAAAHTLGYVRPDTDIEAGDFPGEDLTTFKMPGTSGIGGIEKWFDAQLQGESGGRIYRVDPSGYKIKPPLEVRTPKQGRHLVTSLDIDLQIAAERRLAEWEMAGSAVALDVATGEVLVLASKPDYDLSQFVPRLAHAVWADVLERGAAMPRAIQGTYPPGSAFKILTAIAGLRAGVIPLDATAECTGAFRVGGRSFACRNHTDRGEIDFERAIEKSCNVYFYKFGLEMGPDAIAREARRFRFDVPTGIELPAETGRMLIPDPEWKRRVRGEPWVGGDTANMSIGQGDVDVTPLQMACFIASVARGELRTRPTLLHVPNRPRQRTEPIGLTREQHAALVDGMERVTRTGTARIFQDPRLLAPLGGLTVAGKTGTAQKYSPKGMLNIAWMIGFAPAERPEIAFAVMIEGDTPGEETGGGRYAGPVAHAILKAWLDRRNPPPKPVVKSG
jgi:penicillin-binding protein 2